MESSLSKNFVSHAKAELKVLFYLFCAYYLNTLRSFIVEKINMVLFYFVILQVRVRHNVQTQYIVHVNHNLTS